MPTIVALIATAAERGPVLGRLRDLGTADVRLCEYRARLAELVLGGDVVATVTELHDADGAPVLPVLRDLRRRFPELPVIIYASLTGNDVRETADVASEVGVAAVVIRGADDLGRSVRAAVATAGVQGAATEILTVMLGFLATRPPAAPGVRRMLEFLARAGSRPISVSDAVDSSGLPRSSLYAELRRVGILRVEALIGWVRVLHAAAQLEVPVRTVARVVAELGFPDASALRKLFRQYARLTPTEVRRRGGLRAVLPLFAGALRAGTVGEPAREPAGEPDRA